MKRKSYTINTLYDISEKVLQEKIKSLNPLKNNPELTPDEIIEYPHLGEDEGMTLADIRLKDFVKEGVVSNIIELDKWLSSCLNREDLVTVITNFDLFGPRTRSIAISNPLCYYNLLKEIVANENDNWEKIEVETALANIKARETGFVPISVSSLTLDMYEGETKVLTIETPAEVENIIVTPNDEKLKCELKDNYELIISCEEMGDYSVSISASKEGLKEASITIPVSVKDTPLTDISIDLENITVSEQSVINIDVNTLATNLHVEIDNENRAVATVSGKRVSITGISYGSCKLIITGQAEGYRENTVEFPVTVEQLPATQITVDHPKVTVNQLRDFVVNVDVDSTDLKVEINDPDIIDVEKNEKVLTIKAKKIGNTYFLIKATADGYREGVTTVNVTVIEKVATELEVTPVEDEEITNEGSVVYTIARTNATEVQAEVDKPDIASVNINGIENIEVVFDKPSSDTVLLTIKATADKCKETVITRTINVEILNVTTLTVDETNPKVTVEKEISIPVNTNASTFSFRIKDSNLATGIIEDKNLKLSGVKAGNTEITLEAQAENMRSKTLKLNLTVEEKPLTEISSDWDNMPISVKENKEITITTPASDFETSLDKTGIIGISKEGNKINVNGIKPGECKLSIRAKQDDEHRENVLDINIQVQEKSQQPPSPEENSGQDEQQETDSNREQE